MADEIRADVWTACAAVSSGNESAEGQEVTDTTRVIEIAGETIQPDQWKNRNRYGWFVTGSLLFLYGWALHFDKPAGLLFWLMCLVVTLVMLAPTAAQFGKWLAQVAAIRNGVRGSD